MSVHKKRFIGGFFELALQNMPIERNLAEHWQLPEKSALRFSNARSALAMLVSVIHAKQIWVPAYICTSIIDALRDQTIAIKYYAVGDTLEPDIEQIGRECIAGDIVLAINYFGQAPSEKFRDFVNKRDDLIFIEDCAQTIDTGLLTWGHWRLISPRKVVGVADGGCIIPSVSNTKQKLKASTPGDACMKNWAASMLRFEDEDEVDNLKWHLTNQQRENAIVVDNSRMSRLSYELLKRIDAQDIILRRKNNFTQLYEQLSHVAFIVESKLEFCPFGFPIRLNNSLRTIMHNELIKLGIFAAIHWPILPSPQHQFEKEHLLAKELLTLPCDHRYNVYDMKYMASNILRILRDHS